MLINLLALSSIAIAWVAISPRIKSQPEPQEPGPARRMTRADVERIHRKHGGRLALVNGYTCAADVPGYGDVWEHGTPRWLVSVYVDFRREMHGRRVKI